MKRREWLLRSQRCRGRFLRRERDQGLCRPMQLSTSGRTCFQCRRASDSVFVYRTDSSSRAVGCLRRRREYVLLGGLTRGVGFGRGMCSFHRRPVGRRPLRCALFKSILSHRIGLLQEWRPGHQPALSETFQPHRLSRLPSAARANIRRLVAEFIIVSHLVDWVIDRLKSTASCPALFPTDSPPLAWRSLLPVRGDFPSGPGARTRGRAGFGGRRFATR